MSNYNEFVERRRRGAILQLLLTEANDQGISVPLLCTVLRHGGYRAAEDTVAIDLAFLAQHGFVRLRAIADTQLAAITPRGRDVATGDLVVPGIDRGDGR